MVNKWTSKKTNGELFSEREKEVLGLLCLGLNQEEICKKLFIASSTVKTHLSNIYQIVDSISPEPIPKTGKKLKIVLFALQNNLISEK